ncbi:ABC transporter permease [Rhodococcus sp. HNM0563]|uniref:ABC transporter permease n=1 Tax=Rhodococcus sp. HNM0563 TaxID=2716339 RepID=UPI00146C70EF|nr:ABC transporter permease [Rhodococcus sp. HNM0563]NLU63022.1 ABC transporter permease [Rhodococcus sp. HNM0563]
MSAPLSTTRAIGLVAGREFQTQVQKKSFLISNAIILVAIVAGIVAMSVFGGGDEERPTVGIVGTPSLSTTLGALGDATGSPLEISELPDADAGRTQIAAGELEVALIPGDDGSVVALTESDIDSTLKTLIDAAVAQEAQSAALTGQGVDPAEIAAAAAQATVTVEAIDPPDPEQGERMILAIVAVILLYMQILMFGMYVAMGVVEEKSSRVVELLLSTLRPLQLLWGKILGIGAVGLLQLAAYGVVGVGAALATDTLTITGTAISVFAGTLGWFVLGFAFFAVLYAAAGSMVSRQEDVNSTSGPLMFIILAMFFAAFSSIDDPEATWSTVLSWIPPFSAILMPLRIAAGVASPFQIVGTIVLMVAVTALLGLVAAKIYQRSILRIGRTVTWKEALGR